MIKGLQEVYSSKQKQNTSPDAKSLQFYQTYSQPIFFTQDISEHMPTQESRFNQQISDFKKSRQSLQSNIRILANRIQHLENEEKKVLKTLYTTKNRTYDIITSRNNHSERTKLYDEVRRQKEEQIVKLRQENQAKKVNQKQSIRQIKEGMLERIKREANMMKFLKSKFREHQQVIQEEVNLRKVQSYQNIKYQEQQLQAKKVKCTEQKKRFASMEYKNKLYTEYQQNIKEQEELVFLEQKEHELLQKLKQSQTMTQFAQEDLKKIIKNPDELSNQQIITKQYKQHLNHRYPRNTQSLHLNDQQPHIIFCKYDDLQF